MGAGKSAVGRKLAALLDYRFFDSDALVEENTGVDVAFIFDKEGEAGFRRRESRALRALAAHRNVVVATGGGCVTVAANRELMAASGCVVYRAASPDQLYRRLRYSSNRPLLRTADPKATLRELIEARRGWYEELADLTVSTDGKRVPAVAAQGRAALARRDWGGDKDG